MFIRIVVIINTSDAMPWDQDILLLIVLSKRRKPMWKKEWEEASIRWEIDNLKFDKEEKE